MYKNSALNYKPQAKVLLLQVFENSVNVEQKKLAGLLLYKGKTGQSANSGLSRKIETFIYSLISSIEDNKDTCFRISWACRYARFNFQDRTVIDKIEECLKSVDAEKNPRLFWILQFAYAEQTKRGWKKLKDMNPPKANLMELVTLYQGDVIEDDKSVFKQFSYDTAIETLISEEQLDKAAETIIQAMQYLVYEKHGNEFHPEIADLQYKLGACYLQTNKPELAVETWTLALDILTNCYGQTHKKTQELKGNLDTLLSSPAVVKIKEEMDSLANRPGFQGTIKTGSK